MNHLELMRIRMTKRAKKAYIPVPKGRPKAPTPYQVVIKGKKVFLSEKAFNKRVRNVVNILGHGNQG